MKVYQGNCHYADVTFSLRFEPLEDVDVTNGDCNTCTRIFIYHKNSRIYTEGLPIVLPAERCCRAL